MNVEDTLPLAQLKPASGGFQSTADLPFSYAEENQQLASRTPLERIQWGLDTFGDRMIITSSFGIQAAVTLHMTTRVNPEIPVIMIDTGYLFPETYQFIDELTERLQLNLWVFRPRMSAAWQEQRYGKLWEKGVVGIEKYNQINKVEPMQRALRELKVQAWVAGLRRQQSDSRKNLDVLALQNGVVKIHPILEWTDKDVHQYLKQNDLPTHPLWEQGYVSVGDVHTTKKWEEGMSEEETRFYGLKRECGLHENTPDYSI
ncbi:MAG: phosphoadenylyl-sulfate reductase [Verrucomicrobiota bacterium]